MVNAEAKTEIKETMTFTATSDSIGYTIAEGTTAEGEYKVIVSYAPYQPEDTYYVYLNVSMWDVEDANERYAAYFYTKGEDGPYFVWVDMVEFFDNVYYAEVPEGYDYVIFVRMNGETEDNNWYNMWNQTNDLYILDYLNCVFALDSWGGNGSHCTGHWINPAE